MKARGLVRHYLGHKNIQLGVDHERKSRDQGAIDPPIRYISSQGPTPHGFRLRLDLASGPAGVYELVINLKIAEA